ncbi:PREDICTED: uncharacterized protein LOC105507582 [Colobus angolensis palliatus]|uniref:uncharacterized protein LOC105507582 n=1 Tax=Colobus angolensis palliatus TaxID=336983 RepID=UPI0005F41634|nr:PREDICTED: uncharacterized protein LOC105507582 [Colobus angolensis palliatus]
MQLEALGSFCDAAGRRSAADSSQARRVEKYQPRARGGGAPRGGKVQTAEPRRTKIIPPLCCGRRGPLLRQISTCFHSSKLARSRRAAPFRDVLFVRPWKTGLAERLPLGQQARPLRRRPQWGARRS